MSVLEKRMRPGRERSRLKPACSTDEAEQVLWPRLCAQGLCPALQSRGRLRLREGQKDWLQLWDLMSASVTDNFSDLQSGSVSSWHHRLGTVLSVQETVMRGQAPAHALGVHLTGPRVFKVSKPRFLLPLISSL